MFWCLTDLARERTITLPVAALLKQYKENSDSTIMRYFDILFIQQSIGKLSLSVGGPRNFSEAP
jgi:proteasome component ECM29